MNNDDFDPEASVSVVYDNVRYSLYTRYNDALRFIGWDLVRQTDKLTIGSITLVEHDEAHYGEYGVTVHMPWGYKNVLPVVTPERSFAIGLIIATFNTPHASAAR